jgi:hypothetical protein
VDNGPTRSPPSATDALLAFFPPIVIAPFAAGAAAVFGRPLLAAMLFLREGAVPSLALGCVRFLSPGQRVCMVLLRVNLPLLDHIRLQRQWSDDTMKFLPPPYQPSHAIAQFTHVEQSTSITQRLTLWIPPPKRCIGRMTVCTDRTRLITRHDHDRACTIITRASTSAFTRSVRAWRPRTGFSANDRRRGPGRRSGCLAPFGSGYCHVGRRIATVTQTRAVFGDWRHAHLEGLKIRRGVGSCRCRMTSRFSSNGFG